MTATTKTAQCCPRCGCALVLPVRAMTPNLWVCTSQHMLALELRAIDEINPEAGGEYNRAMCDLIHRGVVNYA